MSIRWRLTLWFSLILCGILVLSGVLLHVLLRSYLNNQVDNNLKVYSARIHGTLDPLEIPDTLDFEVIHSRLPPLNEFASPGTYIQLIDRGGNLVWKSDSLGEQELPVNLSLVEAGFAGRAAIETVSAGDQARVRIMVSPLRVNEQVLLLEVAQSLSHIAAAMEQASWALLASILLALALAAVSGAFIVRKTLSPVRQITRTARGIESSSDLGRRVGYTGPADEIGELATTFDRLIEHLDRAFQSQKYFVADASHELRGPLTVIRGNLDLLKRNISQADRRESLRAIEQEMHRMVKIVDDLLVLAEVDSGKSDMHPVNLMDIVEQEVKRAGAVAGGPQVRVGRLEDLVVSGDAHKLRQLLANLVDNAVRYTPASGAVTLSLYREKDLACLEVADTGIGIAAEHLPHIFERFYRADKARSRASGGTGLGLAIVRGIVLQHGGNVAVASEPGRGSTFTVRLKL
ncbi:MAG: HAMP domain-containing protein [Chloroflexi bacterium]|nr:HAMP domain-containing protein [Chloroflexota bacterium]